uniref:hypothetical protein n=1 Tax=uncultured Tenacibaculum sp. TaxID=174713 RepID=UPI00261913EE|nr:hypothetical protein [uncultured Tenacibaculum sp.]
MKEIVFDSFKSTLQEVKILNNIVVKEKNSKSELERSLKQAQDLLFSSYSNLSVFAESVKSYISVGYKITPFDKKKKKQISKIEAKIIYNKLLSIINSELDKDIIVPTESLILKSQVSSLGLAFISASIDENLQKNNDDLNISKLKSQELSTTLNKYFAAIISYIQDILLYDVFLIFEKPEITYLQEIVFTTDYKKEYIDKWLNCTVTFNELRRNKRTDHWAEIYKLNLDFEHIDKIEKHQKKLFNERIESEIRSALNDFDELDEDVKKEALNKEINLIQDFFNSDTSKTIVKRLKNILSFSKPKEVIIEYDNILRDRLLLSDFNIYSAGKSTYSSVFVASFFMRYLDQLKEHTKGLNGGIVPVKELKKDFTTLIPQTKKQDYILQLLEDLSITVNGKYALSPKRKGAIRGVVEALREKNIVQNLSLEKLNNAIASKINLELKSKLDWSKTSDDYKMKTFKYIENKPFQKET